MRSQRICHTLAITLLFGPAYLAATKNKTIVRALIRCFMVVLITRTVNAGITSNVIHRKSAEDLGNE